MKPAAGRRSARRPILQRCGPEPSIVDYVAMQDVMNEAIQGVVLGEISPAEAAEEAADELERLVN